VTLKTLRIDSKTGIQFFHFLFFEPLTDATQFLNIDEYAKLINLTISRKRKKIFERLKMDFEGKE